MALERIADKVIDTDVLVVGGGIGGCPAAAKAREHGLNVTLVEKSKTDRSGSAGAGIDHYVYSGELTSRVTPQEFLTNWENIEREAPDLVSQWVDPTKAYRLYTNQAWAVQELEKLGVSIKWDDGEILYCSRLENPITRVHWMNVKPDLALAVRKSGVNVLERTMVVDLLTNRGAVVGATAVNTRTGEFVVIKAKATVIGTGCFLRCYSPNAPDPWKYKFRYHYSPVGGSGDGWAAAYRAGAELANMEQTAGGHLSSDEAVLSAGMFENEGAFCKFFTWDGEELPIRHSPKGFQYAEAEQQGKDPLYRSLEHLPDDYHKRIEVAIVDERLVTFKAAEERGFNPRTHRYEVMASRPFSFRGPPGINVKGDFKATAKGLYAIGDAAAGGNSCNHAVISGLLVGNSIKAFVAEAGEPEVDEAQVEGQKESVLAPLEVNKGAEPMEFECAIRYICNRYTGTFRSEGRLREGIRRLGTLRRVFLPKLMAENPHYLMRCLECRNILDLAEVHLRACLARKETRGNFFRLDYPKEDSSLDNLLVFQRMEEGKAVLEMRKVKPLKVD